MDVRINIRRLLLALGLSFVLPMMMALLADWQFGLFPWLTIGANLLCIPLATVIVIRAALSEMDLLIQEIAPLESNSNDQCELN
jgi:hypothetical protein